MGLLILAVVLLVAAGWTTWSRLETKARDDQIPLMAAAKGLHYSHVDPFGSTVLAFPLFHRGDGRASST